MLYLSLVTVKIVITNPPHQNMSLNIYKHDIMLVILAGKA